MSSDAIALLKQDHKQMRNLFRQFARANGTRQTAHVVNKIIEALTVHTYLENECMYPKVRELLPEMSEDVLESYEEHHLADVLCAELTAMSAHDEHFKAKATVLIENVKHHIDEEEQDWFPKVRDGVSRKTLQELGAEMLELRATAPRRPTQPSALKKAVDAVIS